MTAELTTEERDRLTLEAIERARDAVLEALQRMPNDINSRFESSDAIRLDEINKQLTLLEMAFGDAS